MEDHVDPHVTLSGDRAGEYIIREEHADGRLLLVPANGIAETTPAEPHSHEDLMALAGAMDDAGPEFSHFVRGLRDEWPS